MTLIGKDAERQSDAELVGLARAGGASAGDAFGALVRRYQRMVYALALSLVRGSDADDVAQDAFLRAFRNLDLLADPAKFGVWLRRITFGVAIDHVRADRARRAPVDAAGEREDSGDPLVEVPDPTPSPLDRVEQGEVVGSVLAALERMPARYRVPLTLYHIDGLTHAKVARALGVPEGTVRSLVARARRKLARLLANAPEARDMTDTSSLIRSSGDVLEESAAASPRFLHVLNGDSVRMSLEHSDVPGAFAVVSLDVEPLGDDLSGDFALPNGTVSITGAGRAVLAGAEDWVRLDGFDRWLGGVHLTAAPGGDVQWRYDRESVGLVRT